MISNKRLRAISMLSVAILVAACSDQPMDWDFRNGLNTRDAALNATQARPQADAQGIISYPGYQVVIARQGETVAAIASRVGTTPAELARYNAIDANTPLRGGEVIALPNRVASAAPAAAPVSGGITTGAISVTELASGAIDRSQAAAPAPAAPVAAAPQPAQHRVARGETAYSIARSYNVSPKALAEWNGLDANLSLREGQMLMIPVATAAAPAQPSAPGAGSSAPVPPSAADPLPQEATIPASAAQPGPASPAMGEQRTSSARFAMPASGSIIRGYQKGKNEGIDIGATAGSSVVAAADGTVAAITRDTDQVPILVLRHADNTLTVYAGIDGLTVAKGASVSRGQKVAVVRQAASPFLHFEVRKGFESVDPMPYLQ